MNIVIANKYQTMLQSLDIEISKFMTGEFDVGEIVNNFKNFYFQKMIIDITAIKNSKDIKVIQNLSLEFDMNKVIILLDGPVDNTPKDFLSKLISLGVYNFTSTVDGIKYLLNHPNTYKDVAHIHLLDVPFGNNIARSPQYNNDLTSQNVGSRIIGFRNITDSAGATSLIYMLKKVLEKKYSVVAIECDGGDSGYYGDSDYVTATSGDIGGVLSRYTTKDIVLVDINNSVVADSLCTDIVYLVEPSILKLNKLISNDNKSLSRLRSKKLVLNKSLLTAKDVYDFGVESGTDVFFNIPPLNDRVIRDDILIEFLKKMSIGI